MKLANSILPINPFMNNDTFVFYTSNINMNQPYVVAEISANNYERARDFLLGDAASLVDAGLNDNPIYFNGPLNASTIYTVFVWGFSPVPQVCSACWLCCCFIVLFVSLPGWTT